MNEIPPIDELKKVAWGLDLDPTDDIQAITEEILVRKARQYGIDTDKIYIGSRLTTIKNLLRTIYRSELVRAFNLREELQGETNDGHIWERIIDVYLEKFYSQYDQLGSSEEKRNMVLNELRRITFAKWLQLNEIFATPAEIKEEFKLLSTKSNKAHRKANNSPGIVNLFEN